MQNRLTMKTWQLLVLGSLLASVVSISTVLSQKEPTCVYQTDFDIWENVRLKPVIVTDIDGDTIYWKFEDKKGVHLGSFHLEPYSVIYDEKGNKTTLTLGKWGFQYLMPCYGVMQANKLR